MLEVTGKTSHFTVEKLIKPKMITLYLLEITGAQSN